MCGSFPLFTLDYVAPAAGFMLDNVKGYNQLVYNLMRQSLNIKDWNVDEDEVRGEGKTSMGISISVSGALLASCRGWGPGRPANREILCGVLGCKREGQYPCLEDLTSSGHPGDSACAVGMP